MALTLQALIDFIRGGRLPENTTANDKQALLATTILADGWMELEPDDVFWFLDEEAGA